MLKKALYVLATVIVFVCLSMGVSFSDQGAAITSSGETLYYVTTIPPSINVTPLSLDFGLVPVGSSGTLSVAVNNTGAGQLIMGLIASPGAPYSVSGDTCSGQVFPQNGGCSITIQFTPTINGSFPSSFIIPSNDLDNPNISIALSGTSDAALISANPNPVDFGTVGTGGSSTLTLTVQNTGNENLTLATVGGPSAPFSKTGGTCSGGTVLTPTQTCTVLLTFSPLSVGTYNGSFVITSNAINTPSLTVNVKGTATTLPQITVTPNPENFGSQGVGSSTTTTITVQNTGTANLILDSPTLTFPVSPYSIASTTCSNGLSIAPAGTCTIAVKFAPTAVGAFNGSFTISSNTGGVPGTLTTVNLSGSGAVAVSSCTVSFTADTITLGGTSTISWTAISDADGLIPYTCTGNLGSASFAGLSGSTTMTPTATQVCTLTVDNGAGSINTCSVTVTVDSAPTCSSSFSPGNVSVGQSSTLSWTSTDDADSQIPFSCTGNLASGTLSGASGSQSFSPTTTQTCTLTTQNGAGTIQTCTAVVTVDVLPTITATPNPLAFGSVAVGGNSMLIVTVQNTGGTNLVFTTVGSPAAPYSKTAATCTNGGTLIPNQTCTVSIRFAPVSAGTFNGSFIITSNAANAPSLTINLTGNSLPWINITPNPDAFGSVAVGSFLNSIITVKNVGGSNLVLGNPTLTTPAAPFARVSTTCTNNLSIAPNGTCTITMRFSPTSIGSFNGSFTVTSNTGGVAGTPTTANLTGSGIAPLPTCTASFNPININTGGTSTLSWTSTNDADAQIPYSCTGNLGNGTFLGANGSALTTPAATQTCTLTVDNGAGTTATCTATVSVYGLPSCSASFAPATVVTVGGTSTLSWTSTNDANAQIPFTCTGNLGSGTLVGASGSSVKSPTSTQTCTLTAQNGAGTNATCTATVTLNLGPPSCTSSFSPAAITAGQPSTLSWTSANDADGQIGFSCTGNLGSGTLAGASGSSVKLPSLTQTCTLTADNGGGTTNTCTANVTVQTIVPVCSAILTSPIIVPGQTNTLVWSSTNDADGQLLYSDLCGGMSPTSGWLSGASGSLSFTATTNSSTCVTLTATNSKGSGFCRAYAQHLYPGNPLYTGYGNFGTAYLASSAATNRFSWEGTGGAAGWVWLQCTDVPSLQFPALLPGAYGSVTFAVPPTYAGMDNCAMVFQNAYGTQLPTDGEVGDYDDQGFDVFATAPSCTLSFTPSIISTGQTSTLSWTSLNNVNGNIPYVCRGNLGSGILSSNSGSMTVSPTATQECQITVADNLAGSNFCSAIIEVNPPPTCAVSFTPSIISAGQTSTLRWITTNDADGQIPFTCTGNLGSGTLSGAIGSSVKSPTATQTCTLTATDSQARATSCTVGVTLSGSPVAGCNAGFSPPIISAGQTSTLSWACTNSSDGQVALSCSAGNIGDVVLSTASGSATFTPTGTQTCRIQVINSTAAKYYDYISVIVR